MEVQSWVWAVLAGSIVLLVAALIFTGIKGHLTARKMVMIAMLTAVYVVLSLVGTINLWWIRISVDSLPIILAALLYGPVGGLLVGMLGSFLNQLLTYGLMATTPLWLIPATARGVLVGVYAKKHNYQLSRAQIIGVLCVTAVIVTALNTGVMYLDSIIQGYYSYAYVFGGVVSRVIAGIVTAIIMSFIAPPVVSLMERSIKAARKA